MHITHTSKHHAIVTVKQIVLSLLLLVSTGYAEIEKTPEKTSVKKSTFRKVSRTGMRFVSHILKSHTIDVAREPVSSARDLASFTYRSGDAWVRRLDIRFRGTPKLNGMPIPEIAADREPMDLVAWEAWLDQRVAIPETSGSIEFLVGGKSYFDRLDRAILNAEKSVYLQTYIFDNDDVATDVADLLKGKSKDIDVRVLYDGLGSIMSHHEPAVSLPQNYCAPDSMHDYLSDEPTIGVRRIHNRWLMGDHTKSTIIDHKYAYVGGMNVGREYRYDWHDLMVELQGPVVGVLEQRFKDAWGRSETGDWGAIQRFTKKRSAQPPAGKGIRLLLTTPTRKEIANTQLEAIRRSQRYIYIENAYFADDEMVHELCKARKRGVDVRVIIPSNGDHEFMNTSNKVSINRLIENGVRVYDYPEMTHVKAAIFDGWVCFGTANYDKLSLAVNRELNIASSDPDVAERLMNRVFVPDMEKSTEITDKHDLTFRDHLLEILADES